MTAPAYKIIARESGDIIEECDTLDEAVFQVSIYEENDIDNGDYTPDFYQIVREGAIVMVTRGEEEWEVGAFTDLDEGREFAGNYAGKVTIRTRELYSADGSLLTYEEASE